MSLRLQIAPILIAVILFAPALKARFSLNDLALYLAPGALFVLIVAVESLMTRDQFVRRAARSLLFLIPLIPVYIAFFISSGANAGLFIVYGANCALGGILLIYTWNTKGIEIFLLSCACLGVLLSYDSIANYQSFDSLQNASEFVRSKYLPVAFASGLACIASIYFFSTRSNIVYIALFAVNWWGLALSRGRGAVIICAAVSFMYLLYIAFTKTKEIGKLRKFIMLTVVIVLIPFVSANLMALNSGKWNRLLNEFDTELDDGGRGQLIAYALSQISESPVIGNGLGQYAADGAHPHNIVLQFGVDSGILGMLLLLSFFLFLAIVGLRSIRDSDSEHSTVVVILLLMFSYALANYMKSGDAYLGRDWIILAALPLSFCLHHRYLRNSRIKLRE